MPSSWVSSLEFRVQNSEVRVVFVLFRGSFFLLTNEKQSTKYANKHETLNSELQCRHS